MRLALGKKGDYAVRAALALAVRYGDGRMKAREIALQMEIPEAYLPQVLSTLIKAGLVGSVAGPDGGYYLALRPDRLTLRAVVEAAEGVILNDRCVLRGGPCSWQGTCVVHEHWEAAQRALIDRLERTTFAELAAGTVVGPPAADTVVEPTFGGGVEPAAG